MPLPHCRRLAAFCLLAAAPAAGYAGDPRDRDVFVTVAAAQYVETYLRKVPVDLVTGQVDFENSHLVSVGLSKVMIRDFGILGVGRNSFELEGQLVKHFTGQNHVEATAAGVLRSGEVGLVGGSSFNGAVALGLSYAFERPAFEYGPAFRGPAGGPRGVDTERVQFYIGVETEFTFSRASRFHVLGKLHHRSGGYGLISPQRTGSNFLGFGLRMDLGR